MRLSPHTAFHRYASHTDWGLFLPLPLQKRSSVVLPAFTSTGLFAFSARLFLSMLPTFHDPYPSIYPQAPSLSPPVWMIPDRQTEKPETVSLFSNHLPPVIILRTLIIYTRDLDFYHFYSETLKRDAVPIPCFDREPQVFNTTGLLPGPSLRTNRYRNP